MILVIFFIDEAIDELLRETQRRTVVTGSREDELSVGNVQGYDASSELFNTLENPAVGLGLTERSNLPSEDGSENSQIFGYDRNIDQVQQDLIREQNVKRMGMFQQDPRVQVQQEETGSQRVQVSNGYQEPFIPKFNSMAGRVSSGEFLEWSLVFYGTGPETSQDED